MGSFGETNSGGGTCSDSELICDSLESGGELGWF